MKYIHLNLHWTKFANTFPCINEMISCQSNSSIGWGCKWLVYGGNIVLCHQKCLYCAVSNNTSWWNWMAWNYKINLLNIVILRSWKFWKHFIYKYNIFIQHLKCNDWKSGIASCMKLKVNQILKWKTVPVCTWSPTFSSDIVLNFPFSRVSLAVDGKQLPPQSQHPVSHSHRFFSSQ